MKLGRFKKEILLLSISILLGLIFGEIFVRIFVPQDFYSQYSWYKAHPIYRFRHRSNMDRKIKWGEYYWLKTNSRGLREDHEIPYIPGDRWRVVIHGDSMTFGNGVEKKDIFSVITQRYLLEKGIKKGEVINMAVSAHGPSLEYLYFKEEGKKYKPKVVVIAIFLGNDVMDGVRDKAFKLVDGKLVFQSYKIPPAKRLTDTFLYQLFINNSHLVVFLRERLYIRMVSHRELIEAYKNEENFENYISFTIVVWLDFVKEIKKSGGIPVLLLLPTREQILTRKGRPPEEDAYPIAESTRQALIEACKKQNLYCIDMLPIMAENLENPNKAFVTNQNGLDFHYNKVGHMIVGEELGKLLVELYSITSVQSDKAIHEALKNIKSDY